MNISRNERKRVICRKCKSGNTIKFGKRAVWNKGKRTLVQAYQCQNCGYQFRESRKSSK